jgi:hypothetical protein
MLRSAGARRPGPGGPCLGAHSCRGRPEGTDRALLTLGAATAWPGPNGVIPLPLQRASKRAIPVPVGLGPGFGFPYSEPGGIERVRAIRPANHAVTASPNVRSMSLMWCHRR